ncbi:hypothetical protein [Streptomyces sp. NPDC002785]|uniref:hypothetical protein n=1 Tax=Streptomyces sp. NPDC002785 TaxID=3154543 RepID=UPI0033274F6F
MAALQAALLKTVAAHEPRIALTFHHHTIEAENRRITTEHASFCRLSAGHRCRG